MVDVGRGKDVWEFEMVEEDNEDNDSALAPFPVENEVFPLPEMISIEGEVTGDGQWLGINQISYDRITSSSGVLKRPQFGPDYEWMKRLLSLQKEALTIQYQLAYYSTMGGAYSVCNHPKQALTIARHQEYLGRRVSASNVIIRAKLFQYLNLSLLGSKKRAKVALAEARALAQQCHSLEMIEFCETIQKWITNRSSDETQHPF
jgi:hypothetical protein